MDSLRRGASLLAAALVTLFLCTACGKSHQPPPVKSLPMTGKATGAGHGRAMETQIPSVTISPESPSVRDDLHISLAGGSEIGRCRWRINGEEVKGESGVSLPRGKFRKGDLISVSVMVEGKEVEASVSIADAPPRVLGVHFTPAAFYRGIDVTVQPQAEDPDGDEVQFRYLWIINGEQETWEDSSVLIGDRFHRGDRIALQVIPFDGEKEGRAYRTGEITVPDAPPHFVTTPPPVRKTRTYVYEARAEDPDGDNLSYSLESGPAGMTIDKNTGRLTWDISPDQAGEHKAKIEVSDGEGLRAAQKISFDISML